MRPAAFALVAVLLTAADPCVSGPPLGSRPGPYSFLVATGPERGQPTCYVCETGDKPAVVVFARTLNDSVGKLAARLDAEVERNQVSGLKAWVTVLDDGAPDLDARIVAWGKKHAIRTLPLGAFTDAVGPPAYRLAADADTTVVAFVGRKIKLSQAYRSGELTEAAADALARTGATVGIAR